MAARGLSPKQQRFADEYLVDLNATAAARRAGYRGSDNVLAVTGSDNLRNPKVAAIIQQAMDKRAEKVQITAVDVLTGIKRIATSAEAAADFSAALRGHELLGKHLKLFTDKIEHGGKVALTLEDLAAGARELEPAK